MTWPRRRHGEPTVHTATAAQAHPGDELLWVDDPAQGVDRQILGVEAVMQDPHHQRTTVLSSDGAWRVFDADHPVVLLRGAAPLFERLRAATSALPHRRLRPWSWRTASPGAR